MPLPSLGAFRSADGDLCYAMALSDGPTGREKLEADGMLPAGDVAEAGAQLCEGLAVAHAAGLVHGGIRPTNVHFASSGIRLADLGVHAGLLAAGLRPEQVTEMIGVPQYLSPEQVGAAPLDARSDIYSLGATLYEMLTGKPPFGGRTTTSVMASVLADDPDAPAGDALGPRPVVDAILRAIEKVPDDRWPSARAFARALMERTPAAVPRFEPKAPKAGCMGAIVVAAAAGFGLLRLVG